MKKIIFFLLLDFSFYNLFSQSNELKKDYFNLKTLNDSSTICKYYYKPLDRMGYAIHKDNFVTINQTIYDSEIFSILVQGYFMKPKYTLDLKKLSEDGENYIDVPQNDMDNYFFLIIRRQLNTFLKDSALRKKINDDISKDLLKYNEKRKAYEYISFFNKYSEISISINKTDSFTITTRILINGNK